MISAPPIRALHSITAYLTALCCCTAVAATPIANLPPKPSGPTYYFSDCQAGADSRCVPGKNSNSGTQPSSPKRDLSGFDINALPAGSQILFAKGGVWAGFNAQLRNLNVTPTQPLVFDSYEPSWGGNSPPWLKAGGANYAFQFGSFGDKANDGGYTLRNLKLDGLGAAGSWGIHLRNNVRNVTLDNLEITGFMLGVHSGNDSEPGITAFTIRNSHIHHNIEMGMLGDANDLLVEGSTFAGNNFSGSAFNHGIYLSGHGRNGVLRNNSFINNSAVNGVCAGGNITVHGQWDGLLVEGNTIRQDASSGGCYGISINPAYDTAEYFRNVVLRGNTIVNMGFVAIGVASAPGIVVESNTIVNLQPTYQVGILIPERSPMTGDEADTGAVVRHNAIYFLQAASGSEGIALRGSKGGSGTNLQVQSNLIYFGSRSNADHRCFGHTARSNFSAFKSNVCYHAGGNGAWSAAHPNLSSARSAGFDVDGADSDPKIASPSASNRWRCLLSAGSPASLNIGACERPAR